MNQNSRSQADNHIVFQNVYKSFSNHANVLEDVSFTVKKNSITALIGPNGAGKSTIAKLILGIEKPSKGKIVHLLPSEFGYVPQKLNLSINMPISVESFMQVMSRTSPSQLANKYNKILIFARIEELLKKQLQSLSGGQLQRVLLAANLINKPNFIILDEPTQGLDIETTNEFYLLLEQVRDDFDVTIFIISHDLHTVIKKADKVLCLNQHLCCQGKPNESSFIQDSLPDNMSTYHHHHDHIHYI